MQGAAASRAQRWQVVESHLNQLEAVSAAKEARVSFAFFLPVAIFIIVGHGFQEVIG